MKKVSLLLIALLSLGVAAFGQELTTADRERGTKYLAQTRDGIVAATKGLSEAQLKFKPAPDRWSVAETLEHIALAEGFSAPECHRQDHEIAGGTGRSRHREGRCHGPGDDSGSQSQSAGTAPACAHRTLGTGRDARSLSKEPSPDDRVSGINSGSAAACSRQSARPAAGRV